MLSNHPVYSFTIIGFRVAETLYTKQSARVETVPEFKQWQAAWRKRRTVRTPARQICSLRLAMGTPLFQLRYRFNSGTVSTQVPFHLRDFGFCKYFQDLFFQAFYLTIRYLQEMERCMTLRPVLKQLLSMSVAKSVPQGPEKMSRRSRCSVVKVDVGVQPDLHPVPHHWDPNYDWNVWNIRKKAYKLVRTLSPTPVHYVASIFVSWCTDQSVIQVFDSSLSPSQFRITQSATHSTQTYFSRYRKECAMQTTMAPKYVSNTVQWVGMMYIREDKHIT